MGGQKLSYFQRFFPIGPPKVGGPLEIGIFPTPMLGRTTHCHSCPSHHHRRRFSHSPPPPRPHAAAASCTTVCLLAQCRLAWPPPPPAAAPAWPPPWPGHLHAAQPGRLPGRLPPRSMLPGCRPCLTRPPRWPDISKVIAQLSLSMSS
jgi:hypothetical protein